MSTGPSPLNTNTTPTPSTSTRSRLLHLNQTPPTTASPSAVPSSASSSIAAASASASVNTTKGSNSSNQFPVVDEKLFSRYSNTLVAETNRRKIEIADHMKRLTELRKESEYLDNTDWMYESVEKLLGK